MVQPLSSAHTCICMYRYGYGKRERDKTNLTKHYYLVNVGEEYTVVYYISLSTLLWP